MGFSSPLSGTAVTGTVAVSSVPPIVVESGTIDASGSTVELAAGTSVEISGTPAVTVESGSVDIGNTPAVTVESGSIDIGNTPAVTIDTSGGSVPVDATGTVTVASITDPVSVGGTLDVQGVAGGTAIGVAGSVTVESGTVDIGNTPAVTVESGSIDIASGTVDATIQNATLDVTGSTIDVQNVSGGALGTIVLGESVGSGSWSSALATQNATVSIGNSRTLVVSLSNVSGQAVDTMTLSASGVQSGMTYLQDAFSQYNSSGNGTWVIAVIPNMDTEVDFSVYSPAGGAAFTADWSAWGDPEPDSAARFVNPASQVRVMTGGGQSMATVTGINPGDGGTIIDAPGIGYSIRLQRVGVSGSTATSNSVMDVVDNLGFLTLITLPTGYSTAWENLDGLLCEDNSPVNYGNASGEAMNLYIRYDVVRTPYLRNVPV